MLESAILDSPVGPFSEAAVWLEALPARVYQTPQYGEVAVSKEKLERMVNNFRSGVRGQEIATDFDHGQDRAKGSKASGWYRDFEVRSSEEGPSLWAKVEFTEEAKRELEAQAWKYFSLEWDDKWADNSGMVHNDVITGGGLTNRPIAKKMMPINFSEVVSDEVKEAYDLLLKEGFEVNGESKEMEHSEPGTGTPPDPRTDEDGSDDKAIKTGSRRDSPPITKELENEGRTVLTVEELNELYKVTGVDQPKPVTDNDGVEQPVDHGELVAAVKNKFAEQMTPEEKKFSEDYPVQWAEMQRLSSLENERAGKAFSESVATVKRQDGENLKDTEFGLSALAQQKVAEVHKKFSEGTVSVTDFEEAVKTITEAGIVKFGESGSSREEEPVVIDVSSSQGIQQARMLFAEKVSEIQREGDGGMDYGEAVTKATAKFPELAQAYRAAAPA